MSNSNIENSDYQNNLEELPSLGIEFDVFGYIDEYFKNEEIVDA